MLDAEPATVLGNLNFLKTLDKVMKKLFCADKAKKEKPPKKVLPEKPEKIETICVKNTFYINIRLIAQQFANSNLNQ